MSIVAFAAGEPSYRQPSVVRPLPAVMVDDLRFSAALDLERQRADRSGRTLCVVTMPLRPSANSKAAEALRWALRPFDCVSISASRLSILLPCTTPVEAAGLLDQWEDSLDQVGVVGRRRVSSYNPEDPAGSDVFLLFGRAVSFRRRCLDVLVSSAMLALLSPVLLAAALAVRLSSPGPVLFRQERVGFRGRRFSFLKFRSMVVDADAQKDSLKGKNEQAGPIFKIRNDPRMTRVGRFLRKTSIDELPQLWHVLRGEMTLVGPRPPTPDEVCWYQGWQMRRLEMVPGITCIWQVSGRSSIGFEDWMRMDVRYQQVRNWQLDLGLMFRTVTAVLSQRGAC